MAQSLKMNRTLEAPAEGKEGRRLVALRTVVEERSPPRRQAAAVMAWSRAMFLGSRLPRVYNGRPRWHRPMMHSAQKVANARKLPGTHLPLWLASALV